MRKNAKLPQWSQCKRFVKASAHITVTRGDTDIAICIICKAEHDLSKNFKPSETAKREIKAGSSALLAFTKQHFYLHKLGANFDLSLPVAVQGELS